MSELAELVINKSVFFQGKVWKVKGWYASGLVELSRDFQPFNNSTRLVKDRISTTVTSITDLNGKAFKFEYENA